MGVFVVGLYEAVEPVGVVLLEGLHGWVLLQVGNDSIVLKLQQHRQEQGSHVLSLVLEPDQLQQNWLIPHGRIICQDVLLLDVDIPDPEGAGFAVLDVLGNAQNPLLPLLLDLVFDVKELVDHSHDWLYPVALVHS